MSAYRFCRTDDIGLLVVALNRCWAPHFPGEPPMTPAAFKRAIRNLQVWCSSCMVAFAGSDPIGVLIGARRSGTTLVHRIAVHPDHQRQGHGHHLLTSLGSKLAILGPPRLAAEVPEALSAACELFGAAGYVQEAVLTDYTWQAEDHKLIAPELKGRLIIPVAFDDLAANGLDGDRVPVCWERSVETLTARKDDIAGLAIVSDEQIEACVMYVRNENAAKIMLLRSYVDDDAAGLNQLLQVLRARGIRSFRFSKVHESEVPKEWLDALGFRPVATYRLYATMARAA